MAHKTSVYFDYAAATPMDPSVLAVMEPYFTDNFYNPSANYLAAKSVAKDVDDARKRIAHWLGARTSEVTFTAGGTEANNLAIDGVMEQFDDGNLIVSAIEHDSVMHPAQQYDHQLVPVKPDGIVDIDKLKSLINDNTVLISVMYASNEIGTIQPLKKIFSVIDEIRSHRKKSGNDRPLYFHTDACQATLYLDLHASRLGVDLMTINAGKIYGPKQTGALYVNSSVNVRPQILGGGQEFGRRSGTENVAGIIGFAQALDVAQEKRRDESERISKLQQLFFESLERELPEAVINGSEKYRLPNNVHLTLPGHDNEILMMKLDELGVICAVGSACSASSHRPSHVLSAIGLSDSEAQASLRFTMGRQTDEFSVKRAVEALTSVVS